MPTKTQTPREIVIPYRPRTVWMPYHQSNARWRVVVAHRRAGKTVAALNGLIKTALTSELPDPHCAYMAPFLVQAKAVAWEYLKKFAAPIPGVKFNEAELRADFPARDGIARIRLFGADHYEALRGQYLDDVDCDEFGDWDPRAWTEVLRPALADRRGKATFTGTPKGKNTFYDFRQRAKSGAKNWALWELKASQTGLLSAEELAEAKSDMDEAAYAQEFECSFEAAIKGAYYSKELTLAETQGRITKVPIDPIAKVDTWWDLGIDDATAIWFVQDIGLERRVIDYLEVSGEGLPQIARRLEAKGYRYGRHILPHDAEARELGTGVTRVETLRKLGIGNIYIIPAQEVVDGINAVRMILPRCYFDAERCARGIEALRQYQREWDGKRQVFRERPLHNWCSHAADAFRYGALSRPAIKQNKHLDTGKLGIV